MTSKFYTYVRLCVKVFRAAGRLPDLVQEGANVWLPESALQTPPCLT